MEGMSFEYSEDGDTFEQVYIPCVDGVIHLMAGIYRPIGDRLIPGGVTVRGIGSSLKTVFLEKPFEMISYKQSRVRIGKGERKRNKSERWK